MTIFRQSALDQLDAPEELDHLLRTTTRRSWIALTALATVVAAVVAWSVTARLVDQVSGRAVVVARDSVSPVYAPRAGYVLDVLTSQGDEEPRGGVLLRLGPQPDAVVGGGAGQDFVVVAPLAGVTAQVMVRRGERVTAGQQVAVMTRPVSAAEQQALLFVGQEQAARIRPGMTADVAVDVADQDLYGTMRGQVASVSPLPYNDAAVQAAVQSVALARRLPESAGGTPYLVTVTLTTAATTSGFAWAHGSGPDARIPDGALGTVNIVADTRAPISYLVSQRQGR